GFRGILAINPVALELLIARGSEQRALGTGLPARDLVGLAAKPASFLPASRPGAVGLTGLAGLLVEVVGLPLTVGLHAQIDRGDCGVSQLGRAEGLRIARANALEEVLPQGAGILAGLLGLELFSALAAIGARRSRTPLEPLLNQAEAVLRPRLE